MFFPCEHKSRDFRSRSKMFVQFSNVLSFFVNNFSPQKFSDTALKSSLSGRSKINIFQISDCRVMIGLLELLFMYWQLFIFSLALGKIHLKQILKNLNFKRKKILKKLI